MRLCLNKNLCAPLLRNNFGKHMQEEPKMIVSDGALELLKWVALALMTGDHVNRYLLVERLPFLTEAARLSFPTFLFVFAYNLARPLALEKKNVLRLLKRLTLFGVLAAAPHAFLTDSLWGFFPLNILFSFAALVSVLFFLDRGDWRNVVCGTGLFIFLGFFIEYEWSGVALGLSFWMFFKKPSLLALYAVAAACFSLRQFNATHWALAAPPLLFLFVPFIRVRMPRWQWFFYAYYPIHLFVIAFIRLSIGRLPLVL